jgi:hypothetical protein
MSAVPSKGRISYDMLGIASILGGHKFRVPIYQRSYAWEQVAVDDFWDDLKHALDEDEPEYFLGTLVLTPHTDRGRTTVIDGQQRLATTSVLLAALRDLYTDRQEGDLVDDLQNQYLSLFNRREKTREPRLVMNAEDDPFFRELVVDAKRPKPSRDSHERLLAAYDNLRAKLDQDIKDHGRRGDDRMVAWSDFMDDQALVIAVTVPTEADAFVIFETLNDRGAQLTVGDLLKNYLFMRAGTRLATVQTSWVQALASLDISAENEIFVTFLRHHWSSMHGAVRERDLYAGIKDRVTSSGQAVAYAKQLAEAAQLYRAITEPGDDHWGKQGFGSSARTNVRTLLGLELEQNRPLLLAVMGHFTIKEQRKTLQALVSWSVRGLVVGGIGGGRTEKAYCEAAVKVRAGKIKTRTELLTELSPIVPDNRIFQDAFGRARQTKPRIARYLQLALERTKRGEKEPELVPNDDEDEVNLEHVLARNAKPAEWPSFAVEELGTWAHRLGNHCLLKKSENGAIGNKPWTAKKPVLARSSLKLTSEAGASVNWNKEVIAKRQAQLAALAIKTWPR